MLPFHCSERSHWSGGHTVMPVHLSVDHCLFFDPSCGLEVMKWPNSPLSEMGQHCSASRLLMKTVRTG